MTALCKDCGRDTTPRTPRRGTWEWYMVHDIVWRNAGMTPEGYLCIGCLEKRLGRQLSAFDFKDLPINEFGKPSDSPRLRAAKNRWTLPG
jgi:hypothetical protein